MPGTFPGSPKQQRAIATREGLLRGAARVFSRLPYAEARLKDISKESQISEGALYFHFGTKSDVAQAILGAQQERMTKVLTEILAGTDDGRSKALGTINGLAELIATDAIVQAGIKLAAQPIPELKDAASEPYFEWVHITRVVLSQGIEDGSIDAGIDVNVAAHFINSLFVGAQMLSELADSWASLPHRMSELEPFVLQAFVPQNDKRALR